MAAKTNDKEEPTAGLSQRQVAACYIAVRGTTKEKSTLDHSKRTSRPAHALG